MESVLRRLLAAAALSSLLSACGASDSQKFDQDAYAKSLAWYLSAASNNFSSFQAHPDLVGASDCSVDDQGKPDAMVECKVDTFDNQDDALKSYATQKGRMTKGLPANARTNEQKNALPDTPLRFAAISGKGGAVLILTKTGSSWLVGYMFEKAPS